MAPEAKVGALFLVVVMLIAGVALFLGQYTIGVGQYEIIVHFVNVHGLARGAEVRLAGVKIGRVTRVELERSGDFPDQPVAAHLLIDTSIDLYDTDRFVVEQTSLLGEQYLGVRRLTAEQILEQWGEDRYPIALFAGAHQAGSGVVGLSEVTDRTQQLLEQANETLEQIRRTFGDKYTLEQIHQILLNTNKAIAKTNIIADHVVRLANALAETAESGQPKIAEALDHVAEAADNIHTVSKQIRSLIIALASGPIPQQVFLTSANIRAASENIKITTEVLRKAVTGPGEVSHVEATLANVAATTESVKQLTAEMEALMADGQLVADLRETLANLRTASESLQAISQRTEEFILEEETLEDLRTSLRNIRIISEEGIKTVQTAGQVLERVDNTMDRLGDATRPLHPNYMSAYWDVEATRSVGLRGDLNLHLQYGDDPLDFWRIGVRDVGDKETLNLQKSLPLGSRLWGQIGLIQSKLGLGINYQVGPRLLWQAEAYHPDDIRVDLRGIYQLSPDWYLLGGVADSFDERLPFAGLRRVITLRSAKKDEE